MIHQPDTLESVLKKKGWVNLEEKFIDLMGRPADPEAEVVGYKYLHKTTDEVDIIAITSHKSGGVFRICSIPIIGWMGFESVEKELIELFGGQPIKKIKQGVISYHYYIGEHPIFAKATYVMQRDNRKNKTEDLVQISMQVDLR